MDDTLFQKLTTGAKRIIEGVIEKQKQLNSPSLGLNLWMLTIIERHSPMILDLSPNYSIENEKKKIQDEIDNNRFGEAVESTTIVLDALEIAKERGKNQAAEYDLVKAILKKAGFQINNQETFVANNSKQNTEVNSPQAAGTTPNLNQYGRDLTLAAKEGKLTPVLWRDEEVTMVMETLCRRTKRNPVLVGPAGVGKTAIVEGLAIKIFEGKVPGVLRNTRIIELKPSTLVAGASVVGALEKRFQPILQEATQKGIILFIDEIHTIMGAGGTIGTSDIASLLKPALSRGDIACIAATTDDEYRRYIESDSALERRFQPIKIHELSSEQSFEILKSIREILYQEHKIEIHDEILEWLIQFGQQNMRNRHFPDKAIDLLEQCYANAVMLEKKKLELSDVQVIVQRMVGMPLALEDRLNRLKISLEGRNLLSAESIDDIIARLNVTLRGLDIRAARPNTVILLAGETQDASQALAEIIAEALYGDKNRVITIDFSLMTNEFDMTLLVGAPPGYVGYTDSLPLHRLIQTPWSVLRFENIDEAHPSIREAIAQSLNDGWLMDGRGKPIYLSDTVIILGASFSIKTSRSIGFISKVIEANYDEIQSSIASALGVSLSKQIDVYAFKSNNNSENLPENSLISNLLSDINKRFQKKGINLIWDSSMMTWLNQEITKGKNQNSWEHWIDHNLTPALIPHLSNTLILANSLPLNIYVKVEEGKVIVSQQS